MARRPKSTERIVTGVKEIDRKLKELERKSANRAARAGLKKGARLAVKLIKKQVPSRLKSVRKSIGHSVKKAKGGANKGITKAKAGGGVGKKITDAARERSVDPTKAGVGISPANVHWWILGTPRRKPTQSPPHPVVKTAMTGGLQQVKSATMEGSKKAIKRELEKLAKK